MAVLLLGFSVLLGGYLLSSRADTLTATIDGKTGVATFSDGMVCTPSENNVELTRVICRKNGVLIGNY
jgi:hypothetical protein